MPSSQDHLHREFLSEAEELIDRFGRDLVALDTELQSGRSDLDLVNSLFRSTHTLKGGAYSAGFTAIGDVSRELENILDKHRLGRLELTAEVMMVLYSSADLYPKLLAAERSGQPPPREEIDALLARVDGILGKKAEPAPSPGPYDLTPELVGILTEYEEHRLRTNITDGLSLYRLKAVFSFDTIDRDLDAMKAVTKPMGEIITTLPEGGDAPADSLALDFLFASRAAAGELSEALAPMNVRVVPVTRQAPPLQTERPPPEEEVAPPSEVMPPSIEPLRAGDEAMDSQRMPASRRPNLQAGGHSVQTVRVDIRKLDHLMNIVGELGIVRARLAHIVERLRGSQVDRAMTTGAHRLERSFERQLDTMQKGILDVRMVPLEQVFSLVAIEVRKVARKLGKQVHLVISGAETEVDKLVGEALGAPLQHLINNAIDHGIEPEAERRAAGKSPAGTIALNAYQKGSHVVIEMEDDGKGIDAGRVLEKAVERGTVRQEDAGSLSKAEVLNLIFLPGLTTKTVVTDTSGRGVGMDVVKTDIGKVGGVIEVRSEPGIGTRFTITIPITLAILSALMVRSGGQLFGVPIANVEEAVALDPSAIRQIDGREMVTLRGSTLPLCVLSRFFDLPPAEDGAEPQPAGTDHGQRTLTFTGAGRRAARQYVVVTRVGEHRLGVVIDSIVGEQDIVIKALGPSLRSVRGFAGATELGDQRIALVIDVQALVDETRGAADWGRLDHRQ
jgi:two-component system, chemotaxis family, sensor kinase CheA